MPLRTSTVVDFVAARASHFYSFQQPQIFSVLNLKGLQEGRRVDPLVPNQIRTLIEPG